LRCDGSIVLQKLADKKKTDRAIGSEGNDDADLAAAVVLMCIGLGALAGLLVYKRKQAQGQGKGSNIARPSLVPTARCSGV
jgi:hypothetical protein